MRRSCCDRRAAVVFASSGFTGAATGGLAIGCETGVLVAGFERALTDSDGASVVLALWLSPGWPDTEVKPVFGVLLAVAETVCRDGAVTTPVIAGTTGRELLVERAVAPPGLSTIP